ncbi:hypothetical protein [Nocardioides piscis]|nr:hypothetical protein [Nocardioides piscis]
MFLNFHAGAWEYGPNATAAPKFHARAWNFGAVIVSAGAVSR